MNAILNKERDDLYIDTEEGNFVGIAEDTVKNFFKVCCAVLNLRPKQREINPLPSNELKFYLDKINEDNRETFVLDQFKVIRDICHRQAFSLSEKQILQIHVKFKNMNINRKEYLYQAQKQHN